MADADFAVGDLQCNANLYEQVNRQSVTLVFLAGADDDLNKSGNAIERKRTTVD